MMYNSSFSGGISQSLVKIASKYQEKAAAIASYLLENIQAVQMKFSDNEVRIMSDFSSQIQRGFEEHHLGKISELCLSIREKLVLIAFPYTVVLKINCSY